MKIANILVVDDDAAMCRIISRMLSNEHCQVETSQSVAGAIRAIEQKAFDIYVVDFKLPDGSGIIVAERIRSKWGAAPPIICMSGYHPSELELKSEELCISNFLEKPFSRDEIFNAVKRAMGPPQADLVVTNIKDPTPKDPGADYLKSSFGPIKSAMASLLCTLRA